MIAYMKIKHLVVLNFRFRFHDNRQTRAIIAYIKIKHEVIFNAGMITKAKDGS